MPNLLKMVTFVKFSGETSERVIYRPTIILFASALWEIFKSHLPLNSQNTHCRYVTENGDIRILNISFLQLNGC